MGQLLLVGSSIALIVLLILEFLDVAIIRFEDPDDDY